MLRGIYMSLLGTTMASSLSISMGSPAQGAEGYFCTDYNECTSLFHEVATNKKAQINGADHWFTKLSESGDQDLKVGFGFFPSAGNGPKKLLIMSSGIHGLEGYTGSAVQRLFLEEMLPQASRQNIDVLMIHGINAFGMKNHRRHTASRVDLNRNWFASDEFPQNIDDAIYDDFYDLLNPKSQASFSKFDFINFIANSLAPNLSSIESGDLTKAAGQGQYRYPKGLSYGGQQAEPHRKIVTDVLDKFVPHYDHVLAMDLHTGLGRREMQLLPNPPYSARAGELRKEIFEVNGRTIEETGGSDFYSSHGDFSDFICQYSEAKFNTPTCANMLIEFGTLVPASLDEEGVIATIKKYVNKAKKYVNEAYTLYVAVRENQAFNHGATSIREGQEIRQAWTDMFNPADGKWRQMVLDETRTLFPMFLERFANLP